MEPNRGKVLEVYHAHLPVDRFSFRCLVGMYGSGSVRCRAEPYAKVVSRGFLIALALGLALFPLAG
jgi:hypothetical protein